MQQFKKFMMWRPVTMTTTGGRKNASQDQNKTCPFVQINECGTEFSADFISDCMSNVL
jgi:hypothetical protein